MAYLHFTYTFDAQVANQKLYEQIVENGIVYPLRLQAIAQDIMRKPSERLLTILPILRYDDEWLDDPDNDQSQAYLWYTLYLANGFQEAPSLSNNRFHGSHYILEHLLPTQGWQKKDVFSLVFGKRIEDYLSATGYSEFVDLLNLDGRCLSHTDAINIRDKIIQTQSNFKINRAVPAHLFQYAKHNQTELAILIEKAFFDAIEMLSTTEKHGDALFIIRD